MYVCMYVVWRSLSACLLYCYSSSSRWSRSMTCGFVKGFQPDQSGGVCCWVDRRPQKKTSCLLFLHTSYIVLVSLHSVSLHSWYCCITWLHYYYYFRCHRQRAAIHYSQCLLHTALQLAVNCCVTHHRRFRSCASSLLASLPVKCLDQAVWYTAYYHPYYYHYYYYYFSLLLLLQWSHLVGDRDTPCSSSCGSRSRREA